MLLEKPAPRFRVSDASRGMRRQLDGPVRCASFGALLSALRTATSSGAGALGAFGLVRAKLVVSPGVPPLIWRGRGYGVMTGSAIVMLVRRTAR